MVSPRLLDYQARAARIPRAPWAGKGYAPSREAPKYDGLTFQRQQSRDMASRDWDRPIEPLWAAVGAGFCIAAFIAVVTILTLAL